MFNKKIFLSMDVRNIYKFNAISQFPLVTYFYVVFCEILLTYIFHSKENIYQQHETLLLYSICHIYQLHETLLLYSLCHFPECFHNQSGMISSDIQARLVHVFGAIICGSEVNSKLIYPL